jgi:two-component system, OmpR family, response regulator CpxR
MREGILLIDDDMEMCQLLADYLRPEGFDLTIANNGKSGLSAARNADVELVILDVMLPELNGLDVLRQLRTTSNVPLLLLTAKGSEIDRIVGLELGADDYLSKPFNPRELVARIRAILRRSSGCLNESGAKVAVGDVRLDPNCREVTRGGQAVDFTTVEFDILAKLLQSAGRIVTRENLSKTALGRHPSMFDRSIDVHVSKIRKKLTFENTFPDVIKTIRGVGYLYAIASDTEENG